MGAVIPAADGAADRAGREPRTAFVLAGGAALGAMQAGMVHALYERGIVPDLLIGTSAGALNAAFLASRPATVATAVELAAIWRGLRRSDIFPMRPTTLIGGLAGWRDHLISNRALRGLAVRHLQFERLEHAAIPLHLVAFDLLTGTEARLSDGPLADAVLAASAIPGVLPPVRWRGRLLVDGGIADNTPVSHAVALGARRIYVLPTQDPGDAGLARPPRGALAAAVHSIAVLANARLHDDLAFHVRPTEVIVLPASNPRHGPPHRLRSCGPTDQLGARSRQDGPRHRGARLTRIRPQRGGSVHEPRGPARRRQRTYPAAACSFCFSDLFQGPDRSAPVQAAVVSY